MSHVLQHNVSDQIAYFRAYNDDGSAKTDLTSATTGLSLSVFRIGASSVSIASLSDKAADDSTHADGAIRSVGGNLYTVDLPDAATATQIPSVVVRGSYTGGVIEGLEHPIVAYNPATNYASATQATDIETDTQDIQSRLPAALVSGRIEAYLGDSSSAAQTQIAQAVASIDILTNPFLSESLAWVLREVYLQSGVIDGIVDTILVNTTNIQSRLPTALVGGRIDASVGAMAADTLTASALAADAVAEIAASVDISPQLAAVIEDTEDIQSRLPAALVGGRIDASVGAMAADTLTASALAADAVAEIAASVDISPQLAAVIEDTEDIQSRLPALLVDGRISAYADTLSEGFGDSLSSYLADDVASGNWDWPSAIAAIQAGLSTLDASGVRAALGLAAANLDTQIGATNTNVDSAESTILSAIGSITVDNSAIASAVRSELTPELGRIDVDVSSRLAASAYGGSKIVVPVSALPFQVVRRYDNKIILRRFAGFQWTLNNVGDLAGVVKLVFTVKAKPDSEADDSSVLQIVASIPASAGSDGITYVNKGSGSSVRTEGSIVVQSYTEDFITKKRIIVTASDKATALIENYDNCRYDIKQITATDSELLEEGDLVIQDISTRLISS